MKESISIKNFGPIDDIQIEDIKPFTVLVGESGSGKSTLMKVLAIFRHIEKMRQTRSYLKHTGLSKSTFRIRMESYWNNSNFDEFFGHDTEIVYKTQYHSDEEYVLKFVGGELTGTGGKKNTIAQEDLCLTKISFISELRNLIPYWAKEGPAHHKTSLGFYFNEVYNDFWEAINEVHQLDIDFLHIKFKMEARQHGRRFLISNIANESNYRGRNYSIRLEGGSSGMQNTIPLIVILEYYAKNYTFLKDFNNSVIKTLLAADELTKFKFTKDFGDLPRRVLLQIEEPELSLYPDAQCSLINRIVNTAFINPRNETRIILSTHSPYIINHLNLLIKAHEKDKLVEGAKYPYEDLAVYKVHQGRIDSLMAENEKLVNTNILSDTINRIYEKYDEL